MKNIIRLYKTLVNKNYSTLAGAIAFFIVVNGGSILFLIIKLLAYFDVSVNSDLNYLNTALNHISSYTGGFSIIYSIFFLITSLWSSSTLFYHLIKCNEMIYGVKKKYNTFYRIISIFFVLLFLALIMSESIIYYMIKYTIKDITLLYRLFQIIIILITPISITLFFNMFFCPVRLKFMEALKGTMFSFIFYIIITILFRIYIILFANYKKLYGAIAIFVIFMIWLYLISIGLVIGFIINERNYLKLESKKKYNC